MVTMAQSRKMTLADRWHRCMLDPECRARAFQWAVYASLLYTAAGFVVILLIIGGYLGFG